MTVRKNLAFGPENTQTPHVEIARHIDDSANLLQIEVLLNRRPGRHSGGQRHGGSIGRAIVREPVVFLFDEPLSNLDVEMRMQIWVEISNLHAELGYTMIYVTQDQIEAMTTADRTAVLRGGKVEQVGRPLELYNRPAGEFVAGFIDTPIMDFFGGHLSSGPVTKLALACGHAREIHPVHPHNDLASTVGIRPETIEVSTDGTDDISERLQNFEQPGSVAYTYTSPENGEDLAVQPPRQMPLERGQKLHVSFPDASIHIFGNDDEQTITLNA